MKSNIARNQLFFNVGPAFTAFLAGAIYFPNLGGGVLKECAFLMSLIFIPLLIKVVKDAIS